MSTLPIDSSAEGPPRSRNLLLVGLADDGAVALPAGEAFRVLSARNAHDGLRLLRAERFDVVAAEERLPALLGVEFLRVARRLHPEAVRVLMSSGMDLDTLADALNEGTIDRFLTLPRPAGRLPTELLEAFEAKALADANRDLERELRRTNDALALSNEQLRGALEEQRRRLLMREGALRMAKESLDVLPWPVLGIDPLGRLAFANFAAHTAAGEDWAVGADAHDILPPGLAVCLATVPPSRTMAVLGGREWIVDALPLGTGELRGTLLALLPAAAAASADGEPTP